MAGIRKLLVVMAVLIYAILFTVPDTCPAGMKAEAAETVQGTMNGKGGTEAGENGVEPYVFTVGKLDEVRLEGTEAEDFYITNTANSFGIYSVDEEGDLYAYRGDRRFLGEEEDASMQLLARNVIHVDCCRTDITVFLTREGKLYGIGEGLARNLHTKENGNHETPLLLMEGIRYVRCGYMDLVIMKEDNTVWIWGMLSDGYYGGREEKIPEPVMLLENAVMITGTQGSHAALLEDGKVYTWGCNTGGECGYAGQKTSLLSMTCVAENVQAVWMGMLQYNICCTEWEKWMQYESCYGGGIGDCLVIRKQDGSLWACGGKMEEEKEEEDMGESRSAFFPCQIVQEPCIRYEGEDTYRHILEKYELAWNGDSDTVNSWKDTDGTMLRKNQYFTLCYSMKDLTGDGTEELVIGLLDVEEQTYSPCIIYSYDVDENRVVRSWDDLGRAITIYEDGGFELVWGSAGVTYYLFFQLEKDSGVVKEKMELSMDSFEEGGTGYYIGDADSGNIGRRLTEKEFRDIIGQYEAMPQVELEWELLEGFSSGV